MMSVLLVLLAIELLASLFFWRRNPQRSAGSWLEDFRVVSFNGIPMIVLTLGYFIGSFGQLTLEGLVMALSLLLLHFALTFGALRRRHRPG